MPKVWNSYDPDCPKDAVYIGRPSKWGNPFSHRPSKFPTIFTGSAMESVSRYRHFLATTDEGKALAEKARVELKGKDLRCFNCKPCHGSVLLEIANPEFFETKLEGGNANNEIEKITLNADEQF